MEGEEGVSKPEDIKNEVHEEEERLYADMRNIEDSFGTEEIVEGEEMRRKTGTKNFVCGEEVREEDVFALTDETRLTDWGGEVREEMEMKEKREI